MLVPTQLALVKADIVGDPLLNAFVNNSDGNSAIAAIYNIVAVPTYWVWRTFVPDRDIYSVTTPDGTSWSWTTYIGRSQAEREAWRQMVNMAGGMNASLLNVRVGIADIFSGAGGAAQRTHLLTISRRPASRFEKLLATGVGTPAAPSTLGFEGRVLYQDIELARNS